MITQTFNLYKREAALQRVYTVTDFIFHTISASLFYPLAPLLEASSVIHSPQSLFLSFFRDGAVAQADSDGVTGFGWRDRIWMA